MKGPVEMPLPAEALHAPIAECGSQRFARTGLCVARIEVSCCVRCKRSIKSIIAVALCSSKSPVGSSASKTAGSIHQGSRDRYPLPLSPGKLCRAAARSLRQPHFAKPLAGRLERVLVTAPGHQQRHGHVFSRREVRQQVVPLPYETDLLIPKFRNRFVSLRFQRLRCKVYCTARRRVQRSQQMQQRAFARARRPHDRDHLAARPPRDSRRPERRPQLLPAP